MHMGTTRRDMTEYTSQKFSHFQTRIHFNGTRFVPMMDPAKNTMTKPARMIIHFLQPTIERLTSYNSRGFTLGVLPGLSLAAVLLVGGKAGELGAKPRLPHNFRVNDVLWHQALCHAQDIANDKVSSGVRGAMRTGQPVRRQNYVIQFEQRTHHRQWFRFEDIQSCPGDLFLTQ